MPDGWGLLVVMDSCRTMGRKKDHRDILLTALPIFSWRAKFPRFRLSVHPNPASTTATAAQGSVIATRRLRAHFNFDDDEHLGFFSPRTLRQ